MKYRSDIDVYEVKPSEHSEASQWGSVCPQFRFQIWFSASTVRICTSCEIKIKKQDQISLKFNITVSISDCIHIYHSKLLWLGDVEQLFLILGGAV